MYHREQQKWQAMRAVTRERNRLVLFSVNELNAKIDACIARMNPPPIEEVPVIYEEEEDKHATLNKLAIARMFKTTMARTRVASKFRGAFDPHAVDATSTGFVS